MLYLKKFINNKEPYIENIKKRGLDLDLYLAFESMERYNNLINKLNILKQSKNKISKNIGINKTISAEKVIESKNLGIAIKEIEEEIKIVKKYIENLNYTMPCNISDLVENNNVELKEGRTNKIFTFNKKQTLKDTIEEILLNKGFDKNEYSNELLEKDVIYNVELMPLRYFCTQIKGNILYIVGITKQSDNENEQKLFENIAFEILDGLKINYTKYILNAKQTPIDSYINIHFEDSQKNKLAILSNKSDYLSHRLNIKMNIVKDKQFLGINILQLYLNNIDIYF